MRVFDGGFRYRIPGNSMRRIAGESTAWQVPGDATLWFQTDTVNYEGVFQSKHADAIPLEKEVEKKTQPLHVGPPVTIQFTDGPFGMIRRLPSQFPVPLLAGQSRSLSRQPFASAHPRRAGDLGRNAH